MSSQITHVARAILDCYGRRNGVSSTCRRSPQVSAWRTWLIQPCTLASNSAKLISPAHTPASAPAVVWCPKYRRAVLVNGIDVRLKEIIQSVCIELHAEILELEVMPEHVHLLVEVDPQYGIHRLVRAMKGRSSRLLRQEYAWLRSRLPTLWTNAYFVSTVGGAPLEVIKQYIENQKRV